MTKVKSKNKIPKKTLDLNSSAPPRLADEVLFLENSGEMPEVALAESCKELGRLAAEEYSWLQAACARSYLGLIARDLDYSRLGFPEFRGLERALVNLRRLRNFLARHDLALAPQYWAEIKSVLEDYLRQEEEALQCGRPYASAEARIVLPLITELGLKSSPWQDLLAVMHRLPCPDFIALQALRIMDTGSEGMPQKEIKDNKLIISRTGSEGEVVARTALPLTGPSGEKNPDNLERIDMVWSLLTR